MTATPELARFRPDVRRGDSARSRGRILLVEDDHQVRVVLMLTLEHAGYEVVAARDAEHALALARPLSSIDLVVTDVGLPSVSGVELVRRLREEGWDDLGVLYITGHNEETTTRFGLDPEAPLLHKPFPPAELVAAVALSVARR